MPDPSIALGRVYRDRLTGFTGTAIALTTRMGLRPDEALIQPRGHTDRLPRPEWVEATRLEAVSPSAPASAGEG